ncbi:MAG TPA: AEC family transporter, partial [Salinisphaeraceae bacterium]|nr:AEC family transporter [Salinisphaeraceae bacterium]
MTFGADAVLSALVPIFALIVLGHVLVRLRMPGAGFWPQLERLVYYVLFPALLIEKLAVSPVAGARMLPIAVAVLLTLAIMTALVLALRRLLPADGPGFTSIYQGAIRFNTYLGFAAALALYGDAGVAATALVLAVLIPAVNVLSVAVLTRYAGGHRSPALIMRGIVQNPLIIACITGIVLNLSGLGLPFGSANVLAIVGQAALPLGLMTVGAGLRLQMRWRDTMAMLWSLGLKLGVMPAVAFVAALLLGLGDIETRILVLFAALPTASSAYILARQLGGDHTLLASI